MDAAEDGCGSEADGVGVNFEEGEGEKREKVVNLEARCVLDGIKVEANGELGHEDIIEEDDGGGAGIDDVGSPPGGSKVNGAVSRAEKGGDSPGQLAGSADAVGAEAGEGAGTPTPSSVKGKGLRRWRRIRRETSRDGGGGAESSPILMKRGLSGPDPVNPRQEERQKSDGEAESSVASVDNRKLDSDSNLEPPVGALDPELEILVSGTGFSMGYDSDNSEDRTSKSSTAASAPRQMHEFGSGRERGARAKNFGGRGPTHPVQQRGHRVRGGSDPSKKVRGDRPGSGKDISRSSMESDQRSSNAVFAQVGSITSNGRQREGSVDYDVENSDGAKVSEDVQDGYHKENVNDIEGLSKEDSLGGGSNGTIGTVEAIRDDHESFESNKDPNPFLDSITMLQAAQEALEKEIQKFGEIEKDPISVPSYSSGEHRSEETDGISSPSLESKPFFLNKKVENLENKLEQASRVAQASKLDGELPKTESEFTNLFLEQRCRELELELGSMFKKKLEVEIECLVLQRATQLWKVTVDDQFALFEEQKTLSEEYDELTVKLHDAESKVLALKTQAEELQTSCKELVGKDGVLSLQSKACKFSLYFFLQSVMLYIAVWLFVMRLLPLSSDYVPT